MSVALWFILYADIFNYPFRLFVTFVHEGGHAVAALVTGNSVQNLSVAINGSGETYTTQGGIFSQMLIASAGYVGSMAFGALLLVLIREGIAARIVLAGSGILVLGLTLVFGLIEPIVAGGALSGISFTVIAGAMLFSWSAGAGTICQPASRSIFCKFTRRAMRLECFVGSQDAVLTFVAICRNRANGRAEHGERDSHPGYLLDRAVDRDRMWDPVVHDAAICRKQDRQSVTGSRLDGSSHFRLHCPNRSSTVEHGSNQVIPEFSWSVREHG